VSRLNPLYRVLLVCAGNTCRSPLAAAALRRALREDGERVEIRSAGAVAASGSPASPLAVEVAGADGLDLEEHRSEGLKNEAIEQADLILVVDRQELELVRQRVSSAAERTWLLTDYGRERPTGEGIPDPFGGSREAYEECLHRIEEQVARIAPRIVAEVRARQQAETASRERRSR
jgi:protein-tyrosine phosphatase